jgi:hypothetical protein
MTRLSWCAALVLGLLAPLSAGAQQPGSPTAPSTQPGAEAEERSARGQGPMQAAGGTTALRGGSPQYGRGLLLGEGAILHAAVLAETGYDTNVFYQEQRPSSAAIVRVRPALLLTNTRRNGQMPENLAYSLGLSLTYREYLSDSPVIRDQRALSPAANLGIAIAPRRPMSLTLSDTFVRDEEAPFDVSSETIVRYHNSASAQLGFAPGGGRFATTLRYTNGYSWYQNVAYRYGSNMVHGGLLDLSWRWLPKTAVFAQGTTSYVDYTEEQAQGAQTRRNSLGWGASAGLRGLITPKISSTLAVGYLTADYEAGPAASVPVEDPSIVTAVANISWRPVVTSSLTAGYQRQFRNSPLIGTFFYVDAASLILTYEQRLFIFAAEARYEHRRYGGVIVNGVQVPRKDHVGVGGAFLDFRIQPWFLIGAGYALELSDSKPEAISTGQSTQASTGGGPDYVKHQILGRLSLTY